MLNLGIAQIQASSMVILVQWLNHHCTNASYLLSLTSKPVFWISLAESNCCSYQCPDTRELCVCVCIYIYIYIYIYIIAYMYASVHVHIYAHKRVYSNLCACMCALYWYTCENHQCLRPYIRTCIHRWYILHTWVHAQDIRYIHTSTHLHSQHTHMHTFASHTVAHMHSHTSHHGMRPQLIDVHCHRQDAHSRTCTVWCMYWMHVSLHYHIHLRIT
jgi:hypothetical protein